MQYICMTSVASVLYQVSAHTTAGATRYHMHATVLRKCEKTEAHTRQEVLYHTHSTVKNEAYKIPPHPTMAVCQEQGSPNLHTGIPIATTNSYYQ